MASKITIRVVSFLIYSTLGFVLILFYPQATGILIFGFFVMMAKFRNTDKIMAVHEAAEKKETNTHQQQITYSHQYSRNKTESINAVKDKPLSEAEKNVLYGK